MGSVGGGSSRTFSGSIFSGGGGRSRIFPRSIFSGGGVGSRHFPRPIRWGGVVAELFPLTAVTDPKFVLFKHVLCFASIISTLCPKVCPQTARIGGGVAAPCPPSPTPMVLTVCILK